MSAIAVYERMVSTWKNITTPQERNFTSQVEAEEQTEKAPYEAPELVVHGRVEKLTLSTGGGGGGSTVIP